LRHHGITESQAGPILGGIAAVAGWLGTIFGGALADRWRHASVNGRLYVGMATATVPIPLFLWMLNTPSTGVAYALNFPLALMAAMWIGPGASTVTDLVLPRMRASASAAYLLIVTFIGLAMGPYTIGRLSVAVGSLRLGMMLSLFASGIALTCLILAGRHLARDEDSLRDRARRAGEKGV
ncbi:MAG: MFS transporter, partial [Candidatus Binatia bacterium]